ncbi:MAG: hypothetical protein M3P18_06135 [Actinomycetota bacterium]|nr:hypothetical protein [Actinomycetota bacterium]
MVAVPREGYMADAGSEWRRYGEALTRAMSEVLAELADDAVPHALETADYWLSVGITLGLERPVDAHRLLALIEADAAQCAALTDDAAAFIEEALE